MEPYGRLLPETFGRIDDSRRPVISATHHSRPCSAEASWSLKEVIRADTAVNPRPRAWSALSVASVPPYGKTRAMFTNPTRVLIRSVSFLAIWWHSQGRDWTTNPLWHRPHRVRLADRPDPQPLISPSTDEFPDKDLAGELGGSLLPQTLTPRCSQIPSQVRAPTCLVWTQSCGD